MVETNRVSCPVCDAAVAPPANAEVGEIIACNDCGSELEIESISPLALQEAPVVAEDWGE